MTETGNVSHDEALRFMRDLDRGRNMFGALDADVRARLFAVVETPTSQTWRDAHGIVLSGITTLWQALLRHTDYKVSAGPKYTAGQEPPPWPQELLPTSEQLLDAIRAQLGRSGS